MNSEIEIRQIPKKTYIFIAIIIIFGIISFFLASAGKAAKATNILKDLGYTQVSDVKVYGTQEFLREDVNIKGMRYTVSFNNLQTNEHCKGFVLKDYKGNVDKDLLCNKQQ
ncbi:MAG: hypothetical protein IE909_07505 [Campylobacterales bacterium]|nr:hypothetical protein [Campylobacterales bacterium]